MNKTASVNQTIIDICHRNNFYTRENIMLSSNFQAFPTVDSTYFEQGTSTNGGRVSPKPTLSTHGMSTAVKATVRSVAFPLLVDVKSEFIKALPDSMSLRAKRDLMYYLNKASDVVLNKDTLMFVCEE